MLTGVEKDRLLTGKWVQSTGLVYDTWVSSNNFVSHALYMQDGGPVYWGVDDGYAGSFDDATNTFTPDSHPRVFVLAQLRNDGQLVVFAISAKIKALSHEHLIDVMCLPHTLDDVKVSLVDRFEEEILEQLGTPLEYVLYAREYETLPFYDLPQFVAIDSSAAELRASIKRAGIMVVPSTHRVNEGIKLVRSWLKPDENGVPRVIVHSSCQLINQEMLSYKYNDREEPIKQYDHSLDALRYLIWTLRHQV